MAQVARATLPDVIKSREMAHAACATQLSGYSGVEDEFLTQTKAIEENNLHFAQRDRGRVTRAFCAGFA